MVLDKAIIKTKQKCKQVNMKFKFRIILAIILVSIASVNAFAETNLSFGTDISGEFPTTAMYNDFKINLEEQQNNEFMLSTKMKPTILLPQINSILDNVKKFTWYFTGTFKINVSGGGAFGVFGFKLNKKLSLFFHLGGLIFANELNIGITLLWNIYDQMQYSNRDSSKNTFFRLFLSFSTFHTFTFSNRETEGFSFGSIITFHNGNGTYKNVSPKNIEYLKKTNLTMFVLTFKYLLTYKDFQLGTGLGVSLNYFHRAETGLKYEKVNIDYLGSGSVGGISTSLFYKSKVVNLVTVIPFFYLTITFHMFKHFKFQVLHGDIYYLPSRKEINWGFNSTIILEF